MAGRLMTGSSDLRASNVQEYISRYNIIVHAYSIFCLEIYIYTPDIKIVDLYPSYLSSPFLRLLLLPLLFSGPGLKENKWRVYWLLSASTVCSAAAGAMTWATVNGRDIGRAEMWYVVMCLVFICEDLGEEGWKGGVRANDASS